jgi:hypothetical protein
VTPISSDRDVSETMLWPALLKLAAGYDIVRPVDTDGEQPFWDLYAPIARGNGAAPFVVGQLGQSLDGRIATATGRSHYINGPESIRHLHRLRALADAVIVGIGTVVADDPQLTVRKIEGRDPARVVIDPNGRLPPDARILAEDGCPVFVVQACRGMTAIWNRLRLSRRWPRRDFAGFWWRAAPGPCRVSLPPAQSTGCISVSRRSSSDRDRSASACRRSMSCIMRLGRKPLRTD